MTGGIGAYKAVEVARGLQKRGHDVVADHDASARRLRRAGHVRGDHAAPGHHRSVGAGRERRHRAHRAGDSSIDLLLVAPATANIIGKFANGIADDFLTSLYLATRAPVADRAGDEHEHARARGRAARTSQTLAARGVRFVEPGEGYLACGWVGKGRLAEPDDIVEAADRLLAPAGSLAGTAGASCRRGRRYEDLDPVRFVGNRSSGRMGYRDRGRGRPARRRRRAGARADDRRAAWRCRRRARAQRRRDARAP